MPRSLWIFALLLLTAACTPVGVSYQVRPGQLAPVALNGVHSLPRTTAVRPTFREIGTVRVARREVGKPNLHVTDRVRAEMGRRGANAILLVVEPDGSGHFVAYQIPSEELAVLLQSVKPAPTAAVGGGSATNSSSGGGGGTVQVKGYTRKDGTYVRPHTRKAPRRGS